MKRARGKTVARSGARSLLEMTAKQARAFLLKPESYCNVELPTYFDFKPVLAEVAAVLNDKSLASMSSNVRNHEGVNWSLLSNKDGRHAWRPFQLIHPAIYITLVREMTSVPQWRVVRERFRLFQSHPNIDCLSLPVTGPTKRKDRAEQILTWWQGIEQRAIQLSLEYNHVFHADIADCYGAIYTHSIAWALHTKPVAKNNKADRSLLGNCIDDAIQDMRHGQTNGIPQGSVLMDFIAEMVLGYVDLELGSRLLEDGVTEFHILRYRDDYRIFVRSPQFGELILKALTEILIGLGLRLNTAKTTGSPQVITHSLKRDKLDWLRGRQGDADIQKHLLIIHAHGLDFPNAGSTVVALTEFYVRLNKLRRIKAPATLIAIAADIVYDSPRTLPVCSAIISKLLSALESDAQRSETIEKIHRKLSQLPNMGLMEVWLQRISYPLGKQVAFKEGLCEVVAGRPVPIWNSDWITAGKLKAAVRPSRIVNKRRLRGLTAVVKPSEIELFAKAPY